MRMKNPLVLFMIFLGVGAALHAQPVAKGIPYQAVARDGSGLPLANFPVVVRIQLGPEAVSGETFYTETHEVVTDARGLFSLVIGEGTAPKGAFARIPWEKGPVWLEAALQSAASPAFRVISKSRLLGVPYALHAAVAGRLARTGAPEEKTQSIYWTTGGNSDTRPPIHYLGNRDSVDLNIKTAGVTRSTVTKSGQMKIIASRTGPDDALHSYPLIVQGSNQGIYIKVNGSRDGNNNFVTFGDDVRFSWGAIEGQTFPELEAYWAYQLQVTGYIFTGVALGGSIAAWSVAAGGAYGSANVVSGIGITLDVVALAVDLANLLANSITNGINLRNEIGVTYSTGNADYAEWLERVPGERNLYPGQVVGVKQGKVSLRTDQADHLRIVSRSPGALGNMPQGKDQERYEKIAFMGQVPVQVYGPVSARDYILPSGNNDGFAIAVHPQDMKIGDYARIIGVAWESGRDQVPFNLVNVAVGINANYLSSQIEALEKKVDGVTAFLKGESQSVVAQGAIAPDQNAFITKASSLSRKLEKGFSDAEFDQIMDANEGFIRDVFAQAKGHLIYQGFDLDKVPYMRDFIDNPIPSMKQLRRDPAFFTQWAQIDQGIQNEIKK